MLLTAPTGVAAHLIGGSTLHGSFKFPRKKECKTLSEGVANTIRKELFHLEILIIDEVSMVSNENLHFVDVRMRQIFGVNEPFGGKCVILVGDFLQLPPVKASPVFTKFSEREPTIENFAKDLIWEDFRMHKLTKVMRQKDEKYINAVYNLALNKMTLEDVELIRSRECTEGEVINTINILFKNY